MTADVPVAIRRIDPDLPLPSYAHAGDAGADLYAAERVELAPGHRALVGTGVAVALPDGFVGYTNPRSGLAHRLGVTILNAPGTIDAGYRGEIKINLINLDPGRTVVIDRGDRVAQLVVQPVVRARFTEAAELPPSGRGENGHGSSGGHHRLAEENERV